MEQKLRKISIDKKFYQNLMILLDKKGVLGLETTRVVLISLLTLAVIAIAVFLALVSLRDAGIFTAGSQEKNQTDTIISNITTGSTNFFKQIPTVFTLLGVVLIILVVAIVIAAVARFGGGSRGESL